jgi:Fic family protein
MIARIAVARDRILRAPIVPRWEAELRREALVRSAHHSTSIEGNPLSLEDVPGLTADLVAWLNSSQAAALMPVLEAGIAHYELVRIHPFVDGNGRTARALATLILAQRGFDTKRFFALDEYYNQDRASYYEALRFVDATQDLTEWLEYFVQGIAVEMVRIERRVEELSRLYPIEAQVEQISLNARQIRLLDYLRQSGDSISNGEYQELFLVSKRTASSDLSELADHGLLVVEGAGRATRYRLAPDSP